MRERVPGGPRALIDSSRTPRTLRVSTPPADRVELWNTDTRGTWRFGRPGPCTNLGSTGTGISALGVSGNHALRVRYTGGNLRDWQLLTATGAQKTPRQLRLVMTDDAGGRILYGKGVEIHALTVANGGDTLLLRGAPGRRSSPSTTRTGSAGREGTSWASLPRDPRSARAGSRPVTARRA